MSISLSRQLAEGATLIVDDRLTAVQLEAYLASEDNARLRRAWSTPRIYAHGAWAAEAWSAQKQTDRLLLSTAQAEALWRRVIADTDEVGPLLHTGQFAAWAADAWKLLLDWGVDFRELRAREDDSGFTCFLRWADRYRRELAQSGWLDGAELNEALSTVAREGGLRTRSLVWTDLRHRTPALDGLVSALASAGCPASFWEPGASSVSATQLGLADTREELSTALLWAQSKLSDQPSSRIALVIPPGSDSEPLLARSVNPAWGLTDTGTPGPLPVVMDSQSVDREPAIGAALNCLELFSRHAEFRTLSRCLRSPFLGGGLEDRARRSAIEADLRTEAVAQLGFLTAYRSAGLKTWLAEHAPGTAGVIDALVHRLMAMPRYQSPSQWARFAQEILTKFGWPGSTAQVPSKTLETWNRVLTDFTMLTPVVRAIDFETALVAIRAVVARTRHPVTAPLAGITVLSRPEQVGLGYDAAWIAGMTDRAWPRPPQPNPLLPLSLQAAHKMPFATPADALSRCQEITARLVRRVPEVVFSYPLVENDYAAAPSPLLGELGLYAQAARLRATPGYYRPAPSSPLERIEDPVPPLGGSEIPGGASTLAAHARCPLRAFVESRLAARPLEPLVRGISPRQRGILTHRVVELVFADCAGRRELAGYTAAQIDDRIKASVSRALNERFRGASTALRIYLNLERDRVGSLVRSLIEVDLKRDEFTIEGLELKHTAEMAGWQIGCRIDRIDKLADGRLAVIDYKTGQTVSLADWMKPRLLEPQLPLYLQVLAAEVGAIVFGVLQPGRVSYRGYSDTSEAFPGRMGRLLPGIDWAAQRARWAEQLVELIDEFTGGDGRVFVAGAGAATGPFAPLTRVYEQLAAFRDDLAAELL